MHQELTLNYIALMQVCIWFLIYTIVCIKLSKLRANLNNSEILILNMPWGYFADAWPALWPYLWPVLWLGSIRCVAGSVALPSHF